MRFLPFSLFSTPLRDSKPSAPDVVQAAVGWANGKRRRSLLLVGSCLLLAAPLAFLVPAAHWSNDPELFRLLRGMATIKLVMAVVALALVWWRLGRPVAPGLGAVYVGGVCTLALATGLIWQLNAVLPASALFHSATFALLLAAWRDIESKA